MNRTTVIVVGLALAGSIAIGGALGQLSGDDGDNPAATRSGPGTPIGTPVATMEAGTPAGPAPAMASPSTPGIPASPATSPVAMPASPAAMLGE